MQLNFKCYCMLDETKNGMNATYKVEYQLTFSEQNNNACLANSGN